jgi:hypothetical protein
MLILLWFFSFNLHAEVHIKTYKVAHSWKEEWSKVITSEVSDSAISNIAIDKEDLSELGCASYNEASPSEKADFWVVFFSALTRAESAFNPKAISAKSRGHRSFGLLQLAKLTAKKRCVVDDVFSAPDNLRCGVKLMKWQLDGAPVSEDKKLRSDLEGQIFGKYIFQWGPLRQEDFRGRKLLVDWFRDHLDQMPFCQKSIQ